MSFRWAQIHITSWVFRPTSEIDQFYDSSNSKTLGVTLQVPRVVEYNLYAVLAAELRGTSSWCLAKLSINLVASVDSGPAQHLGRWSARYPWNPEMICTLVHIQSCQT